MLYNHKNVIINTLKKNYVANIRKELKRCFPTFKFSVTNRNYSSVNIVILSAPKDLLAGCEFTYKDVNIYRIDRDYLEDYPGIRYILNRIYEIANAGNYDNSDSQIDHFDIGFYVNISIGDWERPFVNTSLGTQAIL